MDWKIPFLVVLFFHNFLVIQAYATPLEVTFIDVGEGESILLKVGNQSALVDTGNPDSEDRVVSHLESSGITHLDWLIVTHPHPDHAGGIQKIFEEIEVRQFLDNGQPIRNDTADLASYLALRRDSNYSVLKSGDRISLGSAELTVLNGFQPGRNWNDNSLVILVNHEEVNLLLMGDVSKRVERSMLSSDPPPAVDLLKVGHHGAADASSRAWLSAVAPEYAVISIDADNKRGYPSPKVLKRLERSGATVLATYQLGDIRFLSHGSRLELLLPR